MSNAALRIVFKSVALSKLQYALSAWYGFTNVHQRDRIEAFMRKSVLAGFYAESSPSFEALSSVTVVVFSSKCFDPEPTYT